jgi:NADPH:quinone reductase-like Zn-dependent oxidoreductase
VVGSDVSLLVAGAIDVAGYKPVLDKHFPLEALAGAFRHQASNTHFGKIVVDI